jgi:hypothetical protein
MDQLIDNVMTTQTTGRLSTAETANMCAANVDHLTADAAMFSADRFSEMQNDGNAKRPIID